MISKLRILHMIEEYGLTLVHRVFHGTIKRRETLSVTKTPQLTDKAGRWVMDWIKTQDIAKLGSIPLALFLASCSGVKLATPLEPGPPSFRFFVL